MYFILHFKLINLIFTLVMTVTRKFLKTIRCG